MFDIAWGEFVVIAVVALIVIGPKELPAVLRAIGQWTAKIRRMAAEFQGQFQEALREAEMADLKKEVDDAARGFTSQFDDPLNLKEATKWEPKPDTAQPDTAKSDDAKPDDATMPAHATPEVGAVTPALSAPPAGDGRDAGDESFPVAGRHPAIEQTPALPSPVSGGGKGEEAAGAASAPPVTPPAAQPPVPERSSRVSDEGGVHP
jgi:sec-independent protein translocase protein TatB